MAFPTTVDTLVDNTTVIHASQVLGPQRITVGPTLYNVRSDQYNGGAKGDGVTDDTSAIQAAINAANAAGGGVVTLPQGVYRTTSALQITANVRLQVQGMGATIQPAASTDGIFVNQANGATALGCGIDGLVIDGQSGSSTTGIRIRDSDRCVISNCRIVNCTTGKQVESFGNGRWAEENSLRDSFIFNCTTGINIAAPGGTHSLGENHMYNVGISGCATGIALNSPCTFYRCRLLGVTIWLPTNGVGLLIDCDVRDSVFIIDLENLNGTGTGLTGVNVTTNALNLNLLDCHLGFTGTFGTAVSDSTGKGMTWSDGTSNGLTTTAGNGFYGLSQIYGDTLPRVRVASQFAGGGGFQFGAGSGVDVNLYRAAANTLQTDGTFKTGAGIQPGTPAGAAQAGNLFQGSGAPSNSNGNNGDYYFRTDTPGTANQRLYVKSAGSWTGIV